MTALIAKINSQIDKIVKEKEGTVQVGYSSSSKPVILKCKNGHTFEKTINKLKSGEWCQKCEKGEESNIIEELFKEFELNFVKCSSSKEISDVTFDYVFISEGNEFLLDIDTPEDLEDPTKIEEIKNKIELCRISDLKLVRISKDMSENKESLEEFLLDVITSDENIILYDESVYSFPDDPKSDDNEEVLQVSDLKRIEEKVPDVVQEKISVDKGVSEYDNVVGDVKKSRRIAKKKVNELEEKVKEEKEENIKEDEEIKEDDNTVKEDELVLPEDRSEYIDKLLKQNRQVALGYCRVSTQYQVDDGVSLDSQEHMIRQYASYKNMSVGGVFKDRGVSGREMTNRHALNEMLELVRPRVQVVVISISRLSRNVEDRITISKKIQEKKGSLMILDLQVDTSTAIGSMLLNLLSDVAEFESRSMGERISTNMQYLSSQGKLRGKPPFGWKFVGKGTPFAREEKEQECIARVRELRTKSRPVPLKKICDTLEKEGYICRKAKGWRVDRLKIIMSQNGIM
jgi:site-specific DNA recombinase